MSEGTFSHISAHLYPTIYVTGKFSVQNSMLGLGIDGSEVEFKTYLGKEKIIL